MIMNSQEPIWWEKEKVESWFLNKDSNIKALSRITCFMDWVLWKLRMELTKENSNKDLKMVKESMYGVMAHFTRVIIVKIYEMEKDSSNQNKEVSKDNGETMK